MNNTILVINGGSSSIKFAMYTVEKTLVKILEGSIKDIGHSAKMTATVLPGRKTTEEDLGGITDPGLFLAQWLKKQTGFIVTGVGHRIVHGMQHTKPQAITAGLLADLESFSDYDPDHMPAAIHLIKVFTAQFKSIPQFACFDTAFHETMPDVAKLLPLPLKIRQKGVRRYGFHGISCSYLVDELERVAGTMAANRKIIIAHLGSGASLTAIENKKSIDTSMGFTPTSGITMSTRAGDLDPGVAWWLMKYQQYTADHFSDLINRQSGLLAVSGTTSDMQKLLNNYGTDTNAAAAVDLFCYQAKKWIGSFAAVLGGADTLIFAGGIGEKAASIRTRICTGLAFLGIELDENMNTDNAPIISKADGKCTVRIMKTDEEIVIAGFVNQLLNN